ncbi:MAG: dockerin type I repeat-containing protein [Prevotella sp.]|nr:dockerin type I repeat-containing protein [Prevotella sp.]
MKKFISILTLLLLGGLFSSELWAYDLYVGGIMVTASNASGITGDGISGSVTYDNSTKTLTLTNAAITPESSNGITSHIDGLKIVVHGNSFIQTNNNGIESTKNLTIKSDNFSVLNITADNTNYVGIWATEGSKLTIEDMWLNVKGSIGILGNNESKLQLTRCYVYVSSDNINYSCVSGFSDIGTRGVKYDYNGITFNATNKRLEYSSGGIVKTHAMMPRIAVGRFIWDVRSDTTITSNTPGSCMSKGTITFNASSRTLTMKGVEMNSESFHSIVYLGPYGGGDLNIKVVGSNTVSLTENTSSRGIYSIDYGVNIYGEGPNNSRLTINNTKGIGIDLGGNKTKTLSLKDLQLMVNSTTARSIYGGRSSKLNIDNSYVVANYGIAGFTDCTLTACHPGSSALHFSSELQGFTEDDETLCNDVVRISLGYYLRIGDTYATKANKNDILGNGQFSYDPETNVLTLNNAKLTTESTCILNRIEDLTVDVVGSANLTSTGNTAIYSTTSMTLKSDTYADLTLNAPSSKYCALWLAGPGHMNIEKLWLTATAAFPIYGSGGTDSKGPELWVLYSNVVAKSTASNSCIRGFDYVFRWSVNLNYDGSEYNTIYKCMYNSDGEILTSHTLKPYLSVKKYIFDTNIDTSLSANSPGAGITSGTIQYKKDGTLTLNNVTIDAEGYSGICYYGEEDLVVKVKGENTIVSKSGGQLSPVYCYGTDLTICGDDRYSSKLTLKNSNAPAIEMEGENTLALKDMNLNAAGTTAYYSLVGHKTVSIDINNCDVTLNHNMNVFKDCTMTYCDVVEPEGAYFSPKLGGFTTNGSSVYSGKVVIGDVSYGLCIGETWVNTSNAPDILGNGQFSYDAATKTLTVKDARLENMDGGQGNGIDNRRVDGLTINFEGYNTITSRNSTIYSEKQFYIAGSGFLNATSTDGSPLFFAGDCNKCIIDGSTLVLNGRNAIMDYDNDATLFVRGEKAYLALNPAEGQLAINNLSQLWLNGGQRIAKPEGAKFSTSLKTLTLDDVNAYKGKAIICKGSLADVNRDGTVDVADIGCVIDAMAGTASSEIMIFADVNADGTVDVADIGSVIDEMAAN